MGRAQTLTRLRPFYFGWDVRGHPERNKHCSLQAVGASQKLRPEMKKKARRFEKERKKTPMLTLRCQNTSQKQNRLKDIPAIGVSASLERKKRNPQKSDTVALASALDEDAEACLVALCPSSRSVGRGREWVHHKKKRKKPRIRSH